MLAIAVAELLVVVGPILVLPGVHAVALGVGAEGTGLLGADLEVLERDAAAAAVCAAVVRPVVAVMPLAGLLARAKLHAPVRPRRPRVHHLHNFPTVIPTMPRVVVVIRVRSA